ncbi:MAG TPA: hypothetical protein VFV05_02280 [Methylomirabilota bacterium]|nr:hypothetical protein [Methylomirabilota bacterium]
MSPLAERLAADLRACPRHFAELVEAHSAVGWRDFLRAWGEVRGLAALGRDEQGRYVVAAPEG